MIYYKMKTTKDDGSILGTTTVWYGLEPDEGAVIKENENFHKEYGVVYAISKDTDTMPIGTLLKHLMGMNRNDLEAILLNDSFLEKLFFLYLQNPMCSKEFRNTLEKMDRKATDASRVASEASEASEIAGLWSMIGMMKD